MKGEKIRYISQQIQKARKARSTLKVSQKGENNERLDHDRKRIGPSL